MADEVANNFRRCLGLVKEVFDLSDKFAREMENVKPLLKKADDAEIEKLIRTAEVAQKNTTEFLKRMRGSNLTRSEKIKLLENELPCIGKMKDDLINVLQQFAVLAARKDKG